MSAVIKEMTIVRARWLRRQVQGIAADDTDEEATPMEDADAATGCLARVSLYAKNLFPPPSLLSKHGVQYYRVSLAGGQVLMASSRCLASRSVTRCSSCR